MPRLVVPSVLIVAGHCGAMDVALKINPHRPSAHLRREREDLVPRRGLEPRSEGLRSFLLLPGYLLQWCSPEIRMIAMDKGELLCQIGHPGGTSLLGAKKKGPRTGSPYFWCPEEDLNLARKGFDHFFYYRDIYFSGVAPNFERTLLKRGSCIGQLATLEALLFWAPKKRLPSREPLFFGAQKRT